MRVGTFPLGSRSLAGSCLSIKRHGGILLFVTTCLVKKRAAMPQLSLPGFPAGATTINETVSVYVEEGRRVWLMGQIEIFRHAQEDHAGFRTIVSALMKGGLVCPSELERSGLKLTHRTLMNWRKQYQEHGASAFYRIQRPRAAGRVMTAPKVSSCQRMLEAGQSVAEVAKEAGINESTLRKAMGRGVLSKGPAVPAGDLSSPEPASTKTERASQDAQAGMGVACTRPQERVAAALGISGAIVRFEPCVDVPLGGVLAALPALEANGLFSGISPRRPNWPPTRHCTALWWSLIGREPPTICCPNSGNAGWPASPIARRSKTSGRKASSKKPRCPSPAWEVPPCFWPPGRVISVQGRHRSRLSKSASWAKGGIRRW